MWDRCVFRGSPHRYLCFVALSIQDFLQFSTAVFNKHGRIKPSLYQPSSPERGTGVWGPEINHGTLAYIDEIRVSSRYQRQGVGRWAIENLLKSDLLAVSVASDSLLWIPSDIPKALSLFLRLGYCSQCPFTSWFWVQETSRYLVLACCWIPPGCWNLVLWLCS